MVLITASCMMSHLSEELTITTFFIPSYHTHSSIYCHDTISTILWYHVLICLGYFFLISFLCSRICTNFLVISCQILKVSFFGLLFTSFYHLILPTMSVLSSPTSMSLIINSVRTHNSINLSQNIFSKLFQLPIKYFPMAIPYDLKINKSKTEHSICPSAPHSCFSFRCLPYPMDDVYRYPPGFWSSHLTPSSPTLIHSDSSLKYLFIWFLSLHPPLPLSRFRRPSSLMWISPAVSELVFRSVFCT